MKNIDELIKKIQELNPSHTNFLNFSLASMTRENLLEFNSYIDYALTLGYEIEKLAEAYNVIVMDTIKEQLYFTKEKKYRYQTVSELNNDVYFNDKYMNNYMMGLSLTTFLWVNHRELHAFFKQCLLRCNHMEYLEVGPGHGYFFLTALNKTNAKEFVGIDLSPESIKMTSNLLKRCYENKDLKSIKLIEADFLQYVSEKTDRFVVMSEVLEHVEKPEEFLRKVKSIATPGSNVYVNTVVNTPAIDHIYLFKSLDEIEELFKISGLQIEDRKTIPYIGKTLEESFQKKLPVSAAYLLTVTK